MFNVQKFKVQGFKVPASASSFISFRRTVTATTGNTSCRLQGARQKKTNQPHRGLLFVAEIPDNIIGAGVIS